MINIESISSSFSKRSTSSESDSLQTKMFLWLHLDENVKSSLIRDFPHQARLQLEGQMTALEDRTSVHTVNWIERFFKRDDRMKEVRLPTACAELNYCETQYFTKHPRLIASEA